MIFPLDPNTLLTIRATRVGRTLLPFPPEQQSEPATSLLPIKVVLKYWVVLRSTRMEPRHHSHQQLVALCATSYYPSGRAKQCVWKKKRSAQILSVKPSQALGRKVQKIQIVLQPSCLNCAKKSCFKCRGSAHSDIYHLCSIIHKSVLLNLSHLSWSCYV